MATFMRCWPWGLSLLYGISHIANFAHGVLFALGASAAVLLDGLFNAK